MQGRGRGRRWRQRGYSRRAVRILKPTLLLLLHHGPAHGYTLLDELSEYRLDDVNPSVVYRALRDMEDRSWVTSTWDTEQTQGPPRRVYQLTATGDQVLSTCTQDLREVRMAIDHLLGVYSRHMEEGEGEHH